MPPENRIFIIDGTAFIYRAFFAIRGLTNSKGRPTNAAFGFARIMLKILREHEPSHLAVVFDAPGPTFRHEMYSEYKATRDETPPDLIDQLPLVDKLVAAFGFATFRVPGVEADDVIATLADAAQEKGLAAVVVSGDKDLLQLVRDGVSVYDPHKGDSGKWYAADDVVERYGVTPEHIRDMFGLMGDSSDNVPGVKGIGEKTARKLLEQYGSIEGVYAHIDQLKGKQRENLEQHKEEAFLSRELVTIKHDVEIPATVEACRRHALDPERLAEVFHELEFQSLLEEFLPDASSVEEVEYRLVLTEDELGAAIEEMRTAGEFSVDTETTSTDPMRAELVGISMSCRAQKAYYIPVAHTAEALAIRSNPDDLFPDTVLEPIAKARVLELVRPLLEDPEIGKVGHNIKYDLIVFKRAGINLAGIRLDTMVASYLTDPSQLRHNLNEVSLQYLKRKLIPISELIGTGSKSITFDNVPVNQACHYACEDADIAWRLRGVFQDLMRTREVDDLFREVELPLISVLARMEMAGIAIDTAVFDELREETNARLTELEADIFELAGRRFLISSPKQLQEILFGDLGLRPVRKTKTGYSTDVDVLEELSRRHPLPGKILEFRTLEKLRGTYIDALPRLVHPETNRIHTSFNQAVTATGRLSSSDPNLQNIPVRTELGRRIRQGFVPGSSRNRLISADYSQVELRILAHLSGDAELTRAFIDDQDIHRQTAARIFDVKPEAVTADMRRQAKAVNFGVVYGISAFGLARNIGVSNTEAQRFIDSYFARFPGVHRWIETTLEEARESGYVMTLLQRRRYVPELLSSDRNTRRAAERAAINTPVQGTAADVIKVAMVRIDKALAQRKAQLLLQVHDELIVEAPEEEAAEVAAVVQRIMEEALDLNVPLKVDVGVGTNWDEIH